MVGKLINVMHLMHMQSKSFSDVNFYFGINIVIAFAKILYVNL